MTEGSRLAGIPFDAPGTRHPRDVWADVKAGLDFVAHNLPRAHALLVRLNPYPRPWRAVTVQGHGGVALSAWYGPGEPGGPAIVILPGTFQTKDDTPRKRRAIGMWRRLGAHVLIVDLRGFGGSYRLRGTAGHLESRDALCAADWLKAESGADKVALWGESLGGAVALLAAARPGAEERFSRVVAWSPFADLDMAARDATTDAPRRPRALARTYRFLLRHRTHNEVHTFEEYLHACARDLGMDKARLVKECSPVNHAAYLRVPSFVFHAEDDPVVPVQHAHLLEKYRGPHLHVAVVPRGGHLDFDRAAPRWFQRVTDGVLA